MRHLYKMAKEYFFFINFHLKRKLCFKNGSIILEYAIGSLQTPDYNNMNSTLLFYLEIILVLIIQDSMFLVLKSYYLSIFISLNVILK